MSSPDVKSKILARRAKFIAAAVTSVGLLGCGSKAEVCLSMVADTGGDASDDTIGDTNPGPCLTAPIDSGPFDAPAEAAVCLSAPLDSGVDASADADTGPSVCLAPPPADGG